MIYRLDAENSVKIAAKEDRKAADFAAMTQDRRDRAAAWSPQEAEARARSDADDWRAEADKTERHYKASDMALNAAANPHYMQALGMAAPEILREIDVERNKTLARDLGKIAMGEMYSDRVLRESVERLEALRDQADHANPAITKDRIEQALVHCKLALHGVRDTHHRLQDASWLIAVGDGLDVEHGKLPTALVVDGLGEDGNFAGDGERAPFVVFDVERQKNIAGPFASRELADKHRLDILGGATANLDAKALMEALSAVGNDSGLDSERGQSVTADEDPRWKAQVQGLQSVTASINASLAPEVIKADFGADRLREYGADVGLEFDGKVETFDDGTISAGFKRDTQDGTVYHVALMVPPGATQVTAYAALGKGEQVLVESEPMSRGSVIGALDAAVASFDGLKAKMPMAEATTQAEAKALAQRVAGEMNAALGDWVQSPAKEWVRSTLSTHDVKTVRVSASTGGVVSINGEPFTPDGDRMLNVTHEAVALSMRVAVDRAPAPVFPIKMDRVFADAPGESGAAWANLCEEENRLAGYLTSLEDGTAVVLGDDAWYLEKGDDQQLVLMHGKVVDGSIRNAESRFDFHRDWVDVEANEIQAYTARVSSVADDFLIDRALWKTMKVEMDDAPSLSM